MNVEIETGAAQGIHKWDFRCSSVTNSTPQTDIKTSGYIIVCMEKETRLAEHGCDLSHLGDQLLREGADPLRERLHVDRLDDLVGGALLVRHPDALLTLHVDEVL